MVRKRKAQSILEYTVLLAAIIAAVIAATSDKGIITSNVKKVMENSGNLIGASAEKLSNAGSGGESAVGGGS